MIRQRTSIRYATQANNLRETCGGCPTIYEWTDNDGDAYYFRLRHGYWRVCHDETDVMVASGNSSELDGFTTWDQAMTLMAAAGLDVDHWEFAHGSS